MASSQAFSNLMNRDYAMGTVDAGIVGNPPPTNLRMSSIVVNDATDQQQPPPPLFPTLSQEDLTSLRHEVLSQTQAKIKQYSALKGWWMFLFFFLGALTLICNILVVGFSSSSVAAFVPGESGGLKNSDLIVAIAGVLATITVSLNTILRSNMNATYFQEAVSKYEALELLVWQDILSAADRLRVLNEKYDSQGVGTLFNFEMLSNAIKPKDPAQKKRPKRYAYPKRNK